MRLRCEKIIFMCFRKIFKFIFNPLSTWWIALIDVSCLEHSLEKYTKDLSGHKHSFRYTKDFGVLIFSSTLKYNLSPHNKNLPILVINEKKPPTRKQSLPMVRSNRFGGKMYLNVHNDIFQPSACFLWTHFQWMACQQWAAR